MLLGNVRREWQSGKIAKHDSLPKRSFRQVYASLSSHYSVAILLSTARRVWYSNKRTVTMTELTIMKDVGKDKKDISDC